MNLARSIINELERLPSAIVFGRVSHIVGLMIEIEGLQSALSIGDRCRIIGRRSNTVTCEVIGFRDNRALALPFGPLEGVGLGCRVEVSDVDPAIHPDADWLGRVVNGFGEAADGKGPPTCG